MPRIDTCSGKQHASTVKKKSFLALAIATAIFIRLATHPNQAAELSVPSAATTNLAGEITALRAEVARLKSVATDQSHVMADVGYHFGNLWFAGQSKNWPLAKFCFDETRAHINWAIRVIPVRKDSAGREVDLKAMWEAIDAGLFSQIGSAIAEKNAEKFTTSYKGAMEGCYTCYKASSKAYLRLQIPTAPPQPIINFDPDAKWPE